MDPVISQVEDDSYLRLDDFDGSWDGLEQSIQWFDRALDEAFDRDDPCGAQAAMQTTQIVPEIIQQEEHVETGDAAAAAADAAADEPSEIFYHYFMSPTVFWQSL